MLKLIDPDHAASLVVEHAAPLAAEELPLADCTGRTLAAQVVADRHYPPFARSMMDGYAVRLADAGQRVPVVGEVAAGGWREEPLVDGRCVAIMTGAPCPPGTEAVVKIEQTRHEGERVALPARVERMQNIVARGAEAAAGQRLLSAGERVTAVALAVAAAVGRQQLAVFRRPSLAVITTGSELVRGTEQPARGQIRDSNGPMLAALARELGAGPVSHHHAPDDPEALARALTAAESADLVTLVGGVSMGRYDLVPAAVAAAGARPVFHKVTQKPGKPLLFARGPRAGQLLFGLPGNPLSCHFCLSRYVGRAIRGMRGEQQEDATLRGTLTAGLAARSERTMFIGCRANARSAGWQVEPLVPKGSADLFSGPRANAHLRLPPGEHALDRGAEVELELIGGPR